MQKIKLTYEPSLLKKKDAFPYQLEVLETVKDWEYVGIFLEQGLGKSKIALDLALYWLENKVVDTVLFVAKKTLIHNWLKEFSAHTHITPKIIGQDRRANFYALNMGCRVMLTHYEAIRSESKRIELLAKSRNLAIVLDESAKIKNPDSLITKELFHLSPFFKKRVIMTGTPVANRPFDIWAQIRFLDNGKALPESFEQFRKSHDLTNDLSNDEDKQKELERKLSDLNEKIASFSIRLSKDSGIISLPTKEYIKVTCEPSKRQAEIYRQIRENLKTVVIQEGIPKEDDSEQLLKRLLRLLQVASNPRLIDESYTETPGKLDYLGDIVSKVILNKEKCIIWTSFIENVEWLAREYKPFKAVKIHGKMGIDERNNSVNSFINNPDCKVLIATPAAAKEGLTLTVANHVIFYDRSFSLDDYLQAQDRIHRISQSRKCYVYNLIMKDTIDDWIDLLLQSKHLAAKLAQGDISLAKFKENMSYSFGEMIKDILLIQK